jgi:hypothetical protein
VQVLSPRFRAEAGDEDAIGFDTRLDQLIPIRTGEIELKPIAGSGREPSGNVASLGAAPPERFDDVRTDFAAALAQARADCRDEIAGAAAELLAHRVHPAFRDSGRRSSPAGVYRTGGAAFLIDHQYRGTVSHAYADRDIRIV